MSFSASEMSFLGPQLSKVAFSRRMCYNESNRKRGIFMFYLLLAIASSTMVSVSMRLSEKRVKNDMGMFIANYLTCVLLSCAFLGTSLFTTGAGFGSAVLQGGFSGFLYLASLFFMQENMHHNGIVLTSAFSKLGVLVPTLMAIVIFRERPEVLQLLGMVVALIAISIIYFEKGAFSQGNKKALLLVTLLVSGASDSMANIYDKTGSAAFKDHYLLFTFGAACLFAVLMNLRSKAPIGKAEIGFGIMIGVPNYFSARFLLNALSTVPAVIAYPVYSVATIVSITLAGVFFFKEQVSKKKKFALLLVVVALVLLNL